MLADALKLEKKDHFIAELKDHYTKGKEKLLSAWDSRID